MDLSNRALIVRGYTIGVTCVNAASRIARPSLLVAAVLAALSLGAAPPPALAHPHAPGDPFADVADTLVAGSAQIAPLAARHQRWKVTTLRDRFGMPDGRLEEHVTRADTPAGRRWCVAIEHRDEAGDYVARDSIWVTAGAPVPIYLASAIGIDTAEVAFDGRSISGWRRGEDERIDVTGTTSLAGFPAALTRTLLPQLPLAAGRAWALAVCDPRVAVPERRLAIQVIGRTKLARGHGSRSCWMVLVSEVEGGASRTVWIDRRTRRVLREESRDGAGNLLGHLDAE